MIKTIVPEKELKPTVALYPDIPYLTRRGDFLRDNINLKLQLIVPVGSFCSVEAHPCLVWLEGGAWRNASPYFRIPELTYFANNGFTVASIQYSVDSDNCWPAPIEDCKCAIRFLRKNAKQFGIDPERIYVAGESAGAHLAALCGLTDDDQFNNGEYNEYSSKVSGTIPLYCTGNTDVPTNDYFNYFDLLIRGNIAENPKLKAEINPMTYADKKANPFLFFHGNKDELVPIESSMQLYEKVSAAGTKADYYIVDGVGHADLAFSQENIQKIILDFMKEN